MAVREAGAASRLALPLIGLAVVATAAGSVASWLTIATALFPALF